MRPPATSLALWASLMPLCLGINISPTAMGGLALARVLFGDSRDVFSSSSGYSGDPSAIRSFTDGPFGMGSGIIMSTGSLTSGSLAPGGTCPSSYTTDLYDAYTATYCGPDSYNGASFLLNVLPTKATTLLIDMVIASCDVISGDKVMVFVNGVNVAKDEAGTPLDSSSKYLSEPWGIPSPNGDTVFAMSSPPLRFSIPLPKTYVELKIAVCDRHDGYGDTAVMIKARPCTNCDQTFKVDYDTTSIVSTTTYEATSVVTQAASGTVRGTISYLTYVTASATSTTLLSSTTSTESTFVATSTSPAMSTSGDATSSVSEISTLTDTATSSDFTQSASSVPISCNQISNPYQGSSNSQFEVVCNSYATGGNNIGPSHEVTGLAPCIDLCSTTSNCKVALFDRSQYLCYLLDGTDGPAANNVYDMATLLSSTSSTAMSSATFSTTTTSTISAPTPCNQLENPSYINGVKLSLLCGKQATGGNQIDYSNQLHSLTECMTLCADTLACRAVTFNNVGNECTLYDGVNGFMSDFNMDMAVVASRPATSSTTEAPTAFSTTTSLSTTSTTAPSGPRSCSQMAVSTYTGPKENKFTLSCDTSSTGESIYRRDEEDSMQGCLDQCDNDSRCIAVNFHPSPYSECDLIESFTGTKPSPGTDFASKVLSSASTSTSSETSVPIESTSESTASTLDTTSSASISIGSPETTSSSSSSELTSETTSAGTLELPSFTTTSAVTSQADTSSPTRLSPSTSLSSSLDALSGTISNPALESTQESTSLSTASAITSLAAISLSTTFTPSTLPDPSLSLSSEAVSESAPNTRLESTSAGESSSLESTTVAATKSSLPTDTTSIEMSTTEILNTKTPLLGTSTTTASATAIETTATASSLSTTSQVSPEIQSTSDASALPSTSSTPPARNIPALGEYTFTGCLRSLQGFPSFTEVATDPDMTTGKCVDLAFGSNYIGVYKEFCYKADLLSDTEFISDARCDLRCPGDPTLFCGGIIHGGQSLLHRAIAPDHLLTLYRKTVSSPPSSSSIASYASSSAPSSSSLQTTGADAYESTSQSSSLSRYTQTTSPSSFSSFTTINLGSKTFSASGFSITKTTSQTRLPTSFPTPTAIHTAYSTLIVDHVYTKTQFAETVTTVTYTTINPSNPTALITTCVPITLLYSPCGCEHQVYPSVDMATVACTQGEDIVTLTVPKAAYETGRASDTHPIVQYPSGWAGGNSNPVVQPTEGPQGGPQHGSKNVPPETPTRATGSRDDSHPSYKVHQPATTTSATGSNGDTQPAQGNTRPSVPAQGSPESNSNTPMNPSQPSSPKSLTTETSTIPTPQLDTSAIPSQSSPLHQDQVPSEPADAPYATPMVVSEARGYSLPSWIAITAIVGMALLL